MDPDTTLAAYDDQVRRRPDGRSEYDDGVIRTLGAWNGIGWSALRPDTTDAVIAAQVARFRELGRSWEWKHYAHDPDVDLPGRLLAAGFVAGPAETLLVAEVTELDRAVAPPPGVDLIPVVDGDGVDALVAVHDQCFGGDHSAMGRAVLAAIGGSTVARSPAGPRSPQGGSSSRQGRRSPGSGAAAPWRRGAAAPHSCTCDPA